MPRTRAARPGFTLIELLTVISIIAVLAALTAGVFARVRAAQARSATDTTLTKINSLIERRWKAVLEQINDDIKNNRDATTSVYQQVLAQVGNADLARAIFTYAKLKNEFPMSFNEARAATPVIAGVNPIPAKQVFAALPAGAAGGSPDESAVCLFLAVTTNAGGGTAAENGGLEQQTGDSGIGGLKCYKDGWGTPIAFVRTAFNSEVNASPFVRSGQVFDPLDPRGKLTSLGSPALGNWWNNAKPPVTWVPIPATYTANANHTWTAISAGPNKAWGADPYGLPPIVDTDPSKDNQLSYRLRREGARGD